MPTTNQTQLAKWGNSLAVRIPAAVIQELNLADNQRFAVDTQDGKVILTPIQVAPKDIYDLFAGWKDDGIRDHELDWGAPQGAERW